MPTKEQLKKRRELVLQAIKEYQFTVAPNYKPTEKEIEKFIKNDANFTGFEGFQELNQNLTSLAKVTGDLNAVDKSSYRHDFSRFVPLLLQYPKVNSEMSADDIEKMNLHNEKVKTSLAPGPEGDQYELECLEGFLKKAEDYVIDFSCKNFNEFAAKHTIPDYDVLEIFYNLESMRGRMNELGSPIAPHRMKALQDKYSMLEILKKQMNSIVDLSTRLMAHYLPGIDILNTPQKAVTTAQLNISEMMEDPDSDYNTQYTDEQREQIRHLLNIYSYIPAFYANAGSADRCYTLGKTLSRYMGKKGFEGECYDEAGNYIEFGDLVKTASNKDISFMVANPEDAVGKDQKNLLVVTMKNGKISTSSRKIAKFPKIVEYRRTLAETKDYNRDRVQAEVAMEYLKYMEKNAAGKTKIPENKPQDPQPAADGLENPQPINEVVLPDNAAENKGEEPKDELVEDQKVEQNVGEDAKEEQVSEADAGAKLQNDPQASGMKESESKEADNKKEDPKVEDQKEDSKDEEIIENPENPQQVNEAVLADNAEDNKEEKKAEEGQTGLVEEKNDEQMVEGAQSAAVEETKEEETTEFAADTNSQNNLEDNIVEPEAVEMGDPQSAVLKAPEIEVPWEDTGDDVVEPEVVERGDPQASGMKEPESKEADNKKEDPKVEDRKEDSKDEEIIENPDNSQQVNEVIPSDSAEEIKVEEEKNKLVEDQQVKQNIDQNIEEGVKEEQVPATDPELQNDSETKIDPAEMQSKVFSEPMNEEREPFFKSEKTEEIKRDKDVMERQTAFETEEFQMEEIKLDKEDDRPFIRQGSNVRNILEEDAKIADEWAHRTEADILKARAGLAKFADKLEKVKSKFKNSREYNDLINIMRQVGKGEYPPVGRNLTPQQQFAYELSRIHDQTEKYLEHKAKDGVKKNVYKKLLVVEQSNKFLKSCLEPYSKFELPLNEQALQSQPGSKLPGKVSEIRISLEDRRADSAVKDDGKARPLDVYGRDLVNNCKGASSMTSKEKDLVANGIRDVDHCMCKIIIKAEKNGNGRAVSELFKMRRSFLLEPFPAAEEVKAQTKAQKAEPVQKNNGVGIIH